MKSGIQFYPGIHQPCDARHFDLACISINRVRGRFKPIRCPNVLLDSGAFTELERHGYYRHDVREYAVELHRLSSAGVLQIAAAVSQDYMCEPFMLAKTGLNIEEHQRLTIKRYDALIRELQNLFGGECPFPIMPVLQGFRPDDYARHVEAYGDRLTPNMWVGVGSVCKRQGAPAAIIAVVDAIQARRADLRLHGFGVKTTALLHPEVRIAFWSADSMAWSFAARKQGRNSNDWREAKRFADRINLIEEMAA